MKDLFTQDFVQKIISMLPNFARMALPLNKKKIFLHLITILTIFTFYISIFYVKTPEFIGSTLRNGFEWVIFPLGFIFYFLFQVKGVKFFYINLSIFLILFGLTLKALWSSGVGEMQAMWGVIYFSDTFSLFSDSVNLSFGSPFTSIAARRPLFSAFFSSLLNLTGKNLQFSLILLVAMNAIACFLLTSVIKEKYRHISATIVAILLFLFYRRFIGTPDTENFGFAMGAIGLTLFLIDKNKYSTILDLLGLLLITLGLLGRAGPFWMIPGIVFWFIKKYQMISKIKPAIFTLISLGIVFFGFSLNFILTKAVTNDNQFSLVSNYAQHLYGITAGGKGWQQIYIDHPYLNNFPEDIRSKEINSLVLQNLIAHPELSVKSVYVSITEFLSTYDASMFGFASGGELIFRDIADPTLRVKYVALRSILLVATFWGLWVCWVKRDHQENKLLLLVFGAILLSVPFLPPRDAGLMRVYAVAIPFIVLIPSLPFSGHQNKPDHNSESGPPALSGFTGVFGSIIILFATIVPIGTFFITDPPLYDKFKCGTGSESLPVYVIPGAIANIYPPDTEATVLPIKIHMTAFAAGINSFPHKEYINDLLKNTAPLAIAMVVDAENNDHFWVLFNENIEVNEPKVINLCGEWNRSMSEMGMYFFETDLHKFSP